VGLGHKQLSEDPWLHAIPDAYRPGMVVNGKVTKITNFGVFVELETELEGLLHISELADHKVANPEDEVKVGEMIEVRILRVDREDRKIGLSRKLEASPEEVEAAAAGQPATPREELKGGMGDSSGPLFSMGGEEDEESSDRE
jgi:small subunit ribosomal protein S1